MTYPQVRIILEEIRYKHRRPLGKGNLSKLTSLLKGCPVPYEAIIKEIQFFKSWQPPYYYLHRLETIIRENTPADYSRWGKQEQPSAIKDILKSVLPRGMKV